MREKEIEEIIAKYDRELRYFAYKYVRDWMAIEDILQEVYLKVYLKMDTYQGKASIKTWIYTITRNQCIDYVRSRSYQSTVLMENPEEKIDYMKYTRDNEQIERNLVEKQNNENLYNNIQALPSDYRKTIFLYYFDDFSYKEISILLNKDISYVKNRLFRGKKMLKRVYETKELIS